MAVMASLQCGKRFSRADFHPMMERPKAMTTCDPAAMYQWIKEQEEKRARNQNPKSAD